MFDAIKFSGYKSFPADKYAEIQRLEYVNLYIQMIYKGFTYKKVEFANQVKGFIDATPVLDLDVQIKKLYQAIQSWNK